MAWKPRDLDIMNWGITKVMFQTKRKNTLGITE